MHRIFLPSSICHHCGRLFCRHCEELHIRRPDFLRPFLRRSELQALPARGQRPPLEAKHCEYDRYEGVRWLLLVPVIIVAALVLTGLAWILGLRGVPLVLVFLLVALVLALPALRQHILRWNNVAPYLPMMNLPDLGWIEKIAADIDVAEQYRETITSMTIEPSAKVHLTERDRENLACLSKAHNLSPDAQLDLPVVAGTLVFDAMGKTLRTQDWPAGSRRWEIRAPVDQIPHLRGDEEASPTHTFKTTYDFYWGIELPKFQSVLMRENATGYRPAHPWINIPLPVQLHANFATQGGRRILALRFEVLPQYLRTTRVVCRSVHALAPGGRMRGAGRATSDLKNIKLEETPLEDGIVEVLIDFPNPHETTEPLSIQGSATFFFFTSLSGLGSHIVFYDSLGQRNDVVKPVALRTEVTLNFKVAPDQLPYSEPETVKEEIRLTGNANEILPRLVACLEEQTQLVTMHQGIGERIRPDGVFQREFHGHPVKNDESGDSASNVWYHLLYREQQNQPQLALRVTAIAKHHGEAKARAQRVCDELATALRDCGEAGGASQPPPTPRPPDGGTPPPDSGGLPPSRGGGSATGTRASHTLINQVRKANQ